MATTNTATKPAAPAQGASASTALAKPAGAPMSGTSRDAQVLTGQLQYAQANYHLVSPATSVGSLPEGCEVALCKVLIEGAETYPVGGGKKGLQKSALDKIAAAAGVSWDPRQSRRLDDGSDPYYCAYLAVGTYRHFDGTVITIQGTKEMDLRPGSAQVQKINETSSAAAVQLRDTRAHIVAHAESKARLRAIRSLGLRSSYTDDELRKPFVVARLMWTGRTEDPTLRRIFAEMQAKAMIGGVQALYGHEPSTAPIGALPAAAPHRPPPVGMVPADEEDGGYVPPPPPTPKPASPPRAGGDLFMPGKKGTPKVKVADADDKDLEYWRGRLTKGLAEGTSQYADKDREVLTAIEAEQKRREGASAGGGNDDGDDRDGQDGRDDAAAEAALGERDREPGEDDY